MADLDAAARGQRRDRCRPALGIASLDQPREAIEAPGCDKGCRGETERGPVQHHAHLSSQRLQRAQIGAPGASKVKYLRDDFDHIDPVEMGENPGGELGAQPEPEPDRAPQPAPRTATAAPAARSAARSA